MAGSAAICRIVIPSQIRWQIYQPRFGWYWLALAPPLWSMAGRGGEGGRAMARSMARRGVGSGRGRHGSRLGLVADVHDIRLRAALGNS